MSGGFGLNWPDWMPSIFRLKPRQGFRRITVGGSVAPSGSLATRAIVDGDGWGLPPNLGGGFTKALPTFDGSVLPNLAFGASPNEFGMVASSGQAKMLSIVSEPTNPTGSGLALEMKFPGPEDPDWVEVFPPADGGGRAPSAWNLATPLPDWNELHYRMRLRFSAGWTQFGPTPSPLSAAATFYCSTNTLDVATGQVAAGNPASPGWAVNQWIGAYVTQALDNGLYWRIISNTANTLTVRAGAQLGFRYSPGSMQGTCYIVAAPAAPNSAFGYNAGTKLWFPQTQVTASGSGTVHGAPWSRSAQIYTGQENNFFGGYQWDGAAGGSLMPFFAPQIHDWDGVGTDGQGAIGLNGAVTFGILDYFAALPGTPTPLVDGTYYDLEFYLKLNDPGIANGIWRVYVDGSPTPLFQTTTATIVPKYAKDVVVVDGVSYTVPVPITAARFRNAYSAMTFGGGQKIPQQTQSVRIAASEVYGKRTSSAAPAIPLFVNRFASGSGITQVSSGVPLAPGQLMPANLAQAGLWRNGVEVACNVTALLGAYHDGSIVALLVQYQTPESLTKSDTATGSSPGAATYELRLSGSAVGRSAQQSGWIKDVPDGVWKPAPSHFSQPVAAVWGPLVPLADVPAGRWRTIDTLYKTAMDRQWEVLGRTTNGTGSNLDPFEGSSSKYDQPMQRIRYAMRGGMSKDLERGLLIGAVSRNYMAGNPQWHNQNVLSLAALYWLTGVVSYRTVALSNAVPNLDGYDGPGTNPAQDEGRITGRNIGWALMNWMLGGGAIDGRSALQTLDDWGVANGLHQQLTASPSPVNGGGVSGVGFRPEWSRDLNAPYGSAYWSGLSPGPCASNFMSGIRAYYADLYRVYRGPGAGNVQTYLDLAATFLRTQYSAGTGSYHYWTDVTQEGLGGGVTLTGMREISLLCATVTLAARAGNAAVAVDQVQGMLDATIAFAEPNTGTPGSDVKQYCENHYTYQFAMARCNLAGN